LVKVKIKPVLFMEKLPAGFQTGKGIPPALACFQQQLPVSLFDGIKRV
jgi:hypothetical protein